MIRIEAVADVPVDVLESLTVNSLAEYHKVMDEPRLGDMWVVREDDVPLAFLQVRRMGLLGSAEFRFLLCEAYTLRHVRMSRPYVRALAQQVGGLLTAVRCDFERGKRFAEFMGFKRTELSGLGCDVYEMRA